MLCLQLGCDLTPGEAREGGCPRGVDSSHHLPDFFHIAVWLRWQGSGSNGCAVGATQVVCKQEDSKP